MIHWKKTLLEDWTLLEFQLDGNIHPSSLADIRLPDDLSERTDKGLVFSGRGPVWLYAHLTHLAHMFSWCGTYEPRLRAAVVTSAHTNDGPSEGDLVPIDADACPVVGETRIETIQPPATHCLVSAWRPFIFVCVALLMLCSLNWITYELWTVASGWIKPYPIWVLAIVCTFFSAGFVAAALSLYQRRFLDISDVSVLLTTVALLGTGQLACSAAHDLAADVWLLVPVSVATLALYLLQRMRFTRLRSLRVLKCDQKGTFEVLNPGQGIHERTVTGSLKEFGFKHLVLPVSTPNRRPCFDSKGTTFDGEHYLSGDLTKDIEALQDLQPNWQQLMRAVRLHADQLESVWLVGSTGCGDQMDRDALDREAPRCTRLESKNVNRLGSVCFLDDAAKLLRRYLPKADITLAKSRGLSFSRVDLLQDHLKDILTKISKQTKATADQILVDTTCGQKPTSIVGAVSTLNRTGFFQYVDTSGSSDVYLFDLRIETSPAV